VLLGTKNILFENKINARLFGKDVDFLTALILLLDVLTMLVEIVEKKPLQ
jgi:hypothetical protein